ncbi:MAG TPA: hypothetical protein VE964_08785 [Myxococcales bacterium]|nr:hypothetical protein [Myxococcales bacterium]
MAYPYDTYQNPDEVSRLKELGQSVPSGVDIVGPGDEVTPQERKIYFPQGEPAPQHRGALAELAFSSSSSGEGQQQQLGAQNAPPATPSQPRASQEAQAAKTQPSAQMWTQDPVGYGKAAQKRGQIAGIAGITNFVADVVKLAAGAYGAAGGAAAGGAAAGGGAGGAAAGGEAAGAAVPAATETGAATSVPAGSVETLTPGGSPETSTLGTPSPSTWDTIKSGYQQYQKYRKMLGGGGGGGGGTGEADLSGEAKAAQKGAMSGDPGGGVKAGVKYLEDRKKQALDLLSGNYMSPTQGGFWSTQG